MKRYYLLLFLLIVVLLAGAKKKVTNLQPLWPDGSVMSEWFNDTAKIDVKTLGKQYVITKFGVKNDPTILQTAKIQAVIDRCANEGGGVVVIPRGTFLTGALFFQKGTHLHFEDEAVLKGIDDIRHYPLIRMHMEGQMIDYFAALVTAQNADGFTITGKGTIDGNGLRFWTNHLYRCERVRYIDCHIESPTFGDYHAPSSDAIDLDVCDDVVVRGCYMNICDDAVCLKGGKGTYVDRDSTAGAVNCVLVEQCRFGNHVNAAVTFGSEAWNCHNVIMRNCQMEDAHRVLLFKMRPDTPQQYGDVLVENCTGTTRHSAIEASTWTQFYNKQERKDMPVSSVRNVSVRNLDIKTANFFKVDMKQSFTLNDFTLENINVMDKHNCYQIDKVENLKVKNVVLNSKQINK